MPSQDQRTNNDLLKHYTQKSKDRETRTPRNTGVELRCEGSVSMSWCTCGIRYYFFDGGFLLTRKLLDHFERFTVTTMTWISAMEYMFYE
jgi:hypothetical protein